MVKNLATIFAFFILIVNLSAEIISDRSDPVVSGVVVVKFKTGMNLQAKNAFLLPSAFMETYQITEIKPLMNVPERMLSKNAYTALSRIYEIRYQADMTPYDLAREIKKDLRIEYAEPKYLHFNDQQPEITPNDSLFTQQTHLPVVRATQAWDISRGEEGDVIIAVIDGGTEIRHPDLQSNIWINENEIPGDSLDNDDNGWVDDVYGWNFPAASGDPTGLPSTPGNANHGTHVAGVISGVSDNQTGISGVTWNARVMAVNAGSVTSDNVIAYGYEGILYAALNGAKVISCSWGRGGAASFYEQDVINAVTNGGALVVASAGNDGDQQSHFPSSYTNVLSVAATDDDDIRAGFSNYGQDIDMSAPGVFMLSTFRNGGYGRLSGTSFSCPLAAGAAGLVLTHFPGLSPLQAGEQIRVTADDIDDKNPTYRLALGKGRLNLERALTQTPPSVRLHGISFTETDGDSIIEPGETVDVFVALKNYLTTANNIVLTLVTSDPYVTLLNPQISIPVMNTLEEKSVETPFRFSVVNEAPIGNIVQFDLLIASGDYTDFDHFKLTILPTFQTSSVNNVAVTVTNVGRIGSADIGDPEQGIGFRYKNGSNLLFEGSLIAGTGPDRISNSARTSGSNSDADFRVTTDGNLMVGSPGKVSGEEITGKFADTGADNPLNIKLVQKTYASVTPGREDFMIFRYAIENRNGTALSNFHFGIFFDWDMDGENFATNRVDFDPQRNMGYVYDTGGGPGTYVGMLPLSDGGLTFRAIYNDQENPDNPSWGLYDAYTDREKWESISGGLVYTSAGPADVSASIGLGPYTIEANQQLLLGFALIAGDNLSELQQHADSTLNLWNEILLNDPPEEPGDTEGPFQFMLLQNYPNPFNDRTIIRYELPQEQRVTISIYNILGERVTTLIDQNKPAGENFTEWNGVDDSGRLVAGGLYFYRIQTAGQVKTRKLLFLK